MTSPEPTLVLPPERPARKSLPVHIGGIVAGEPTPAGHVYPREVLDAMIAARKEAGLASILVLERPIPAEDMASIRTIADKFLGFVKDLWVDDCGRLMARIRMKNDRDAASLGARMEAMGWTGDDTTAPAVVDPLSFVTGDKAPPETGGPIPMGWDLVYLFLRPLTLAGSVTCPTCGGTFEAKAGDNLGRVRLPNSHTKPGAALSEGFCPSSGHYVDLNDTVLSPATLLDGKLMTDAEVKKAQEKKSEEKRRVGQELPFSMGEYLHRKKDEYTAHGDEAAARWAEHLLSVLGKDGLALRATVGDTEEFEATVKPLMGKTLDDLKKQDEALANQHKEFNKKRGIQTKGPRRRR